MSDDNPTPSSTPKTMSLQQLCELNSRLYLRFKALVEDAGEIMDVSRAVTVTHYDAFSVFECGAAKGSFSPNLSTES